MRLAVADARAGRLGSAADGAALRGWRGLYYKGVTVLQLAFTPVLTTLTAAGACAYDRAARENVLKRAPRIACWTSRTHWAYAAPAFVAALFYYPIAAFLVPNLQFKSKALDVKYAPSFVVAVFQGKLLLAGLAAFHDAGTPTGAATLCAAALGVSAANVLSAVLAVALLPRFARSTLLVVGNALSCAAALALALGLYEMAAGGVESDGGAPLPPWRWRALSVGACCAKTVFHQIGPGAVYFVAVTELGPPEVTTPIYSLGNTAKYAFECLTSFTFLSLRASVGNVPLVVFFAVVNALCAVHGAWVSRVGLLR